jgi:hypothetical protein
MKIEVKDEFGNFVFEMSKELEAEMRIAAQIAVSGEKDEESVKAAVEKLLANYKELTESSIVLLLGTLSLAFCMPAMVNYVFNTIKSCFEPLAHNLAQENQREDQRETQKG